MKNRSAHKGETGSLVMASGYATNARPNPSETTSVTFFPSSRAMWPTTVKMVKPALLNLLYEDRAINPPHAADNEKNICVAACFHTSASRIFDQSDWLPM